MKTIRSKRNLSLLALALGLTVTTPSFAQEPTPIAGQQPQQAVAQQPPANQDPIESLKLTPEQREQVRTIREANKDQRAAVNQQLRQAQLALEDALDSDNPNETLVEQRAREVGEAQAAAIRMRSLQEVRIRRVLTTEQQSTLRQLRLEARHLQEWRRQQQRLQNQTNQGRRPGNLPNQRTNALPAPGARRNGPPRKPPL